MEKARRAVSALLLLLLSSAAAAADLNIAPTAEEVDPVKVGETAPGFTVQRVDGSDYNFEPAGLERPTMIITFRGGWCPFCNQHLKELRTVVPELKKQGFDVLFLSADRPEILYSSLQEDLQDVDYLILSDSNMVGSSALGVAFRVPDDYLARLAEFGKDLEVAMGNSIHALPVPAVFIVDTKGVVQFAHTNADYTVRLSADEVRKAASAVM